LDAVDYLTGLAFFGVVAGGFWVGAGSLRAWLAPEWTGAPAILARVVLALALAVVASELLGLVGLLNVPALAIASVCLAAGLHRWRRGRAAAMASPPPAPRTGGVALALAVAAILLTAIHWMGPVLESLDVGIYRQDSVWYHLPLAAWFAQTGSVTGLLLTDPLKLTVWYYPLNSELLHAIGMVALGNDLLSPLLNFGWMGVALLAAWCIGRPLGLAAATLLAAVLVVDSDMMLVQAGNAPGDIVALACLLAAIAILANGSAAHAGGRGGLERLAIDRGPLAIAALAAGLAIGTKVTMLVPVGAITVAVIWAERDGSRLRAAVWLGGLLIGGGFWYLRNLAHSGNPLPWINFGPLPGPHQEAMYPRPAHSMAEYIADRHAWTHFFLPGFSGTLGPLWYVVLFAAAAGIVLGLRRRHSPLIRVLALAAAAILVAHVLNPISAPGPEGGPYGFASNLRYAAPGIAIGLVLLPLCESRWMARRVLVPAYALLAGVAAITSAEWVQPKPAMAVAIGGGAVLVAIWLARGPLGGRRRLVLAAAVAAIVVVAYPQQRQYFKDRYRTDVAPPLDNPGFRSTGQWRLIQTWAREQHGLRIGIVGMPAAYGQYVLYGEDLSNEVRYLGEPQPAGGLTPIKSCRRWRRLIDDGGFDVIVTTPKEFGLPFIPKQVSWTAVGGSAKPVLNVLPAGVFALAGPLDPALCRFAGSRQELTPAGRLHAPYLPPGWLGEHRARPGKGRR
jgi:hypothetical protein